MFTLTIDISNMTIKHKGIFTLRKDDVVNVLSIITELQSLNTL
jgi:hypothetical protein